MSGTSAGPYSLGQVIRMSTTVLVSGVATDPGGITLTYKLPDGSLTTVQQAQLVKDSTGVYHFDLATTQAGTHFYRFVTTGVAQGAEESSFVIRPQETK